MASSEAPASRCGGPRWCGRGSRDRGMASNRLVPVWLRLHVWGRNLGSANGGASEAP
jgi:hypothetical protein